MPKVNVFYYSQIVKTDQYLTVKNFAQKSSLNPTIIANIASKEGKEGGVIDKYKCGLLDDSEFRTNLMTLLKNLGSKKIEDKEFDECWNSMCNVDKASIAKLYEIQERHNDSFHVIGNTNMLQHNFIQNKLSEVAPNLKISYTLSFEVGSTNPEELKVQANKYINDHYPLTPIFDYTDHSSSAVEILGNYYS